MALPKDGNDSTQRPRDLVVESQDLKDFAVELRERLPDYVRRAAAVPPEAKGSVEWFGRIGKFWWNARERVGLSRHEVARAVGLSPNQVVFLECGNPKPDELTPEILQRYATALGKPELYSEFTKQFDL